MKRGSSTSLRSTLLRWLLLPAVLVVPINALLTYRESVAISNAAYDRSLLMFARSIAEGIRVDEGVLVADLPYAAIDTIETGLGDRIFYRVTGPQQRLLGGYDDLPAVPADVPMSTLYPVLVQFYDGVYRGLPVWVAALHQPISEEGAAGMALVQVAETLEARAALIERVLVQAVAKQLVLLVLAVAFILMAVRRGLSALDDLRRNAEARSVGDLTPFDERAVPAETRAFVEALNRYIARLAELILLRKRFIENAAHQLRTPIAVLKTQVALAQREDDPQALRVIVRAMSATTDGAARLANQLLSLTRAEHGPAQRREIVDLVAMSRQVCLDFAARAIAEGIDFGLETESDAVVPVDGDAVQLQEMLVNLVDNAMKYGAPGERVTVAVHPNESGGVLTFDDSGPGIPVNERENVLRRFYRMPGQPQVGSGLGLAIVDETARQHGGTVELQDSPLGGLRVRVQFPPLGSASGKGAPVMRAGSRGGLRA